MNGAVGLADPSSLTIGELTSILSDYYDLPTSRQKKDYYIDLYTKQFAKPSSTTLKPNKKTNIPATSTIHNKRLRVKKAFSDVNDSSESESEVPIIKLNNTPSNLADSPLLRTRASIAKMRAAKNITDQPTLVESDTREGSDDEETSSSSGQVNKLVSALEGTSTTTTTTSSSTTRPTSLTGPIRRGRKSWLPALAPRATAKIGVPPEIAPAAEPSVWHASPSSLKPIVNRLAPARLRELEATLKFKTPSTDSASEEIGMSSAEMGWKILSHIVVLVVLVGGALVFMDWLHTVGSELAYCPSRPAMADDSNPLTRLFPTCVHCETATICRGKDVTGCYHQGDVLEVSALAEYLPFVKTWPLPLARPHCIKSGRAVLKNGVPSRAARIIDETKATVGNWLQGRATKIQFIVSDYTATFLEVVSQPDTYTLENLGFVMTELWDQYNQIIACFIATFGIYYIGLAMYLRYTSRAASKRLAEQVARVLLQRHKDSEENSKISRWVVVDELKDALLEGAADDTVKDSLWYLAECELAGRQDVMEGELSGERVWLWSDGS
ncbi:hypothetical protein SmJEL517_g00409 [Synchytrium microbalum]|uniref:Man1/Src1 C-terminal domain-containing protein n=1 Tax=Synchytrium microbalum TaxID=1806994 RepID=A0A507CIF4_9FUNG|nr:uncharacterized protein SmJEL517_g00409 [Synchytrium microbalum]TPX37976.1 hypothetical protein SmJEL517_g00409 [Synchytrium microbalum]